MHGLELAAIQALAGHESPSTTQRYMHLAPVFLEQGIRLLEGPAPHRQVGGAASHGN